MVSSLNPRFPAWENPIEKNISYFTIYKWEGEINGPTLPLKCRAS